MNKARKLAEDLVNKSPVLFSNDFDANKRALDKLMMIRNRALRNQIAGAITVLVRERTPKNAPSEETLESASAMNYEPIQRQSSEVPVTRDENSSSSPDGKKEMENETVGQSVA